MALSPIKFDDLISHRLAPVKMQVAAEYDYLTATYIKLLGPSYIICMLIAQHYQKEKFLFVFELTLFFKTDVRRCGILDCLAYLGAHLWPRTLQHPSTCTCSCH